MSSTAVRKAVFLGISLISVGVRGTSFRIRHRWLVGGKLVLPTELVCFLCVQSLSKDKLHSKNIGVVSVF